MFCGDAVVRIGVLRLLGRNGDLVAQDDRRNLTGSKRRAKSEERRAKSDSLIADDRRLIADSWF
jgi:hypothetical protein